LGAGDLRGFAEAGGDAQGIELVDEVADSRAGGEARGRVALAAFRRDEEFLDGAVLALLFGRPVEVFLRLARGMGDRHEIAVAFDGKAGDRLAGLLDALDDAPGPARLDADDDAGGDVGVAAGADERAEMQLQILAELQPSIGMGQGEGALDVVGDRLRRRVRQIVERQDDDMVADADAAVLAAVAVESQLAVAARHPTTSWS